MIKPVQQISILFFIFFTGWSVWPSSGSDSSVEKTVNQSDPKGVLEYKTYPSELEKHVQKVLLHYPDLREQKIKFVYDESVKKSVMVAQPDFSALSGIFKRQYIIKMRPSLEIGNPEPSLHELPENVLSGWLAHELGHIMDYLHRDNAEMAAFGVKYLLSESFMKRAEARADSFAVAHGHGCVLTEMKSFIQNTDQLTPVYKEKINSLYPSPDDLDDLISAHNCINHR